MGWISVKKQLPKVEGYYIVYCAGDYRLAQFSIKEFDESNWHDTGFSIHPSHWMRLPMPPK